ncbi:hypothetical protein F4808DRAFT_406755 [Astrocystis sublimbata]|nr:hypothetical protein F4808DRAFT_406755 [Astrocystis sublimbata]
MASRNPKDSKPTESDFKYVNATPFRIWRSDGSEMPAEYSQYGKVEEGAPKIIDWQNKLGQMIAMELVPGTIGQYFLQDFPTHYHLRWYQSPDDKKTTHYYLFGYPEEPGTNRARKYYRSPNHFLPHLLWLVGESEDRGDCACEFCSGSKPITSKSAKRKVAAAGAQTAPRTATGVPTQTSTNTGNAVASMQRNTTTQPSARQKPTSRSTVVPQQPATQPTIAPQQHPMPQPSNIPQQTNVPQQANITQQVNIPQQRHNIPRQTVVPRQANVPPTSLAPQTATPYPAPEGIAAVSQGPNHLPHDHNALFRAGEVVWFRNVNSWRVGMILSSGNTLSIVPFGHPLFQTEEVIKEEADIRPFLAFSVPQINNGLHELKGRALAHIDWQALQERFGAHADASRREGLAIEATKLAATRVDQCYSTFNVKEATQEYDAFGGVFLGAEKICVGEAVRIKPPQEQQIQGANKGMPIVMVISGIMVNREKGTLTFEGSLWQLQPATLTQQLQTPNQAQLPSSLRGEKEFRDSMLHPRGWRVEWALMNQRITVPESEIRGRFYETRRLTPILNPAKFQQMLQQQHIDDIQTLLNNRGDSSGPYVGRVLNRAQAVAGAVPVVASLGSDVIEAMV